MNPWAEAGIGVVTWTAILAPMVACYLWRQSRRPEPAVTVAERITAAPMTPAEMPVVVARDSEPFQPGVFTLGGAGSPRIRAGEDT